MRAREVAREIVRCCRSLWEAGLIAGLEGNVSVKLAPDRILVRPRGVMKCELSSNDLVEVDLTGHRRQGCREATTELDLHLRISADGVRSRVSPTSAGMWRCFWPITARLPGDGTSLWPEFAGKVWSMPRGFFWRLEPSVR